MDSAHPDDLREVLNIENLRDYYVVEGGDNSFKVPKSVGVPQEESTSKRWMNRSVVKAL